ncbi:unnamed protein product [Meloidogyne enterolobii]|uniref:Uncharacterized protein n=1 Tax=Meloidogyne enterolobii TaxID=390850 RepID=A0ACB0Y7T6_MELEN
MIFHFSNLLLILSSVLRLTKLNVFLKFRSNFLSFFFFLYSSSLMYLRLLESCC